MRHVSVCSIGLLLALAIVSLSSMSANAQCFGPPYTGTVTQYTGGEVHVQVSLINEQGFYNTNCWTGPVYGVLVYRRTIGNTCGEDVLVTTQLLPWNADAGWFEALVSAEVVDAGVEPNTAYEYFARPVSAQPNTDCFLAYVSTGPSLICRGTLDQAPDCGISMISNVNACVFDCFNGVMVGTYPPEAQPYFNTGTILAVYGEFDGWLMGFCNTTVPRLTVTHVEESECIVGVEPATWGAVKARYR